MQERTRSKRWAAIAGLALSIGIIATDSHASEANDAFDGVDRVRAVEMSAMRAGDGDVTTTVASTQDFDVSSEGNSFLADSITNGTVSLGGETMKDFGGVANLVFATGNGNSINATVNLVIMLEQ